MCEYLVEIGVTHNLEQINLQISGEEAGASEFISSSISFHDGHITNIVKFKEIEAGTVPKKLTLVKHDEEPPSNTAHVWSGVMIVSDTNEAISAYRAT
ncbi:MAG: hypothetical protein PVJ60_01440, partial [Phycisphaerales bacterium]|jgi:hypothetical protein